MNKCELGTMLSSRLAMGMALGLMAPSAVAQVGGAREGDTIDISVAFACVVIGCIAANAYLIELIAPRRRKWRWQEKWEFSAATLGGFSWKSLTLWSLLSLFMELLMIRWISSEIRIFAYFKNFVLIACFLGFGLGCYLSRRKINLLLMVGPLAVLTLIVQLPWRSLRLVVSQLPTLIGVSANTSVWGAPSAVVLRDLAAATAVIVPIFGLITLFFVPMGQLVGWYLENAPKGIVAYSVNVFAGLCGIVAYTFLCFLSQPPRVWFLAGGVLLAWLLWSVPRLRWTSLLVFIFCLGLLSLPPSKGTRVYWSPYQKLTLGKRELRGQLLGYSLNTNESWYQQIIDLSPQFVEAHPDLFRGVSIEWNAYNIPYHFYERPGSVLILGSGMGNDVAAALRNGAGQVTAVEIDPLILKLGQELHPEQPYASPRVRQVNDDARSYVEHSNERFDMIVFSLLDSHTTSSYYTNIRIDNYVYTIEALEAAKRLLKPDGVFIVKFQVQTPWVAGRLDALLSKVFEHTPVQFQCESTLFTSGGRFFVTGSEQGIQQALSNPVLAKFVEGHRDMEMESAPVITDDWPYFYQRSPGVPMPVIVISIVLIALCAMLLRGTGAAAKSVRWHFVFLGAGFMLLEAQIVSKMALLFGTTWLVNSIVIGGLLLLILAANAVVGLRPTFSATVAYVGLFATLILGFLVPVRSIFVASLTGRILASVLVLCLPVFFAGIVFIRSFAREAFSSDALGSNLLGAMVGGMLESASLWTGIRWLLVFAAVLYVASWIAMRVGSAEPVREVSVLP